MGNISCAYFHLILFEFLESVTHVRNFHFSFPNLFCEENFPKNKSNSWTTFLAANKKSRRKLFEFMTSRLYVVVVAVLKISLRPEMKQEMSGGGSGSRKYNFSQLR